MTKTYAPHQTDSRGHLIKVGEIEMYYEEYGSGKPLLLLHGFGGCVQNWHPFIEDFSSHYRLILVDLRGHGYSTNTGKTFTHRQAATDVYLLLEKFGIHQFAAMGMSTGAMVLLHMATMQPDRIPAMVLVSVTSHFPEQARTIMRNASFSTMPQIVRDMYMECAKRGEQQIRELIGQFNAFYNNHDDVNFDAQTLATIKANTFIIHGDSDNFFPREIPLNISHAIPVAELWIIEGGEHVPVFDPAVPFTLRALQFLDKNYNI